VIEGGREFLGTFTCLDHFGNVLLFDAYEQVALKDTSFERPLQQIVVPLELIKSASVLVCTTRSATKLAATTSLRLKGRSVLLAAHHPAAVFGIGCYGRVFHPCR
jgi:small nuclear ribonucleoprotein (snRNP)-like protein